MIEWIDYNPHLKGLVKDTGASFYTLMRMEREMKRRKGLTPKERKAERAAIEKMLRNEERLGK